MIDTDPKRSWMLRAVLCPICVALGLSLGYKDPTVTVLLVLAAILVLLMDNPFFKEKSSIIRPGEQVKKGSNG